MIRALVPAIAVLAAFLVACGDAGVAPSDASQTITSVPAPAAECAPERPHAAGDYAETIAVDGLERAYVVHVPASYSGGASVPVVLGFHGLSMSSSTFAGLSELPAASDTHGFLLVMLDGSGVPSRWNTSGGASGANDVAFASAVIDAVSERYCVDLARIYAVGYSNGGGMSQALACAMPERIAAIGVVASTFLPCRADVPMIAFHGTDDRIVPFEGGATPPQLGSVEFPSVRRAVTEWARGLGCDALAQISRPSSEVELSTFKRCVRGDGVVLLYTVLGGGHTWPGSTATIEQLGFSTQQIGASETMWEFFEAYPLP